MAQAQLFWIFLDDLYPLEDLKKLNLTGFNWSSCHESGQTVLARHICNTLMRGSPGPSKDYRDGLQTMEWLIHSGANIEQKCLGAESCFSGFWWKLPPFCVPYTGRSAISYTRALQKKLQVEDGENTDWLPQKKAFLAKVLQLFAAVSTDSSPNAAGPRVSIHESIAELWEKSLAAKDSHDLTIETADGVVTAHAHMLKAASSVVAAMLESPMKESKTARIEIQDTSGKAASLFLEILYTCSAQEEPEYETALHALDLAHRWQVEAVVAILTDLLAGMITDASFAAITEHALLKDLERLKTAAQRFGAESTRVQADLKAGRLPAAVAQLFRGRSNPSKPKPKPKRRWM